MANFVPKFNSWRLTFTLPLINQARHVCFLVNANKNADLIDRVLEGELQYPASRVKPISGQPHLDSWGGGMIPALFR